MNLGLAPLLQDVCQIDVQAFAYLDDIYLMAQSPEVAREAYRRFRKTARRLGFVGTRALVEGPSTSNSKATRIVDTAIVTVPVLKTYEIDALGISLTDGKAQEMVVEARKHRPGFQVFPGAGSVRKVSRCQALTTAAVRARNQKYLGPSRPLGKVSLNEATPEMSPAHTAQGGDRADLPSASSEREGSASRGKSHRSPRERCAVGEARTSPESNSHGNPATQPSDAYPALVPVPPGRGRECAFGLVGGGVGSRACASSTPSGGRGAPYAGNAEVVLSAVRISSRSAWNESIQDQKIVDSSRSNRPYGRTGTSPGSLGRPRGVLPVSSLPEVRAAVHQGKPIKVGNLWKRMALNFTGFGRLAEGLPEGTVTLIVNTLLRSARTDRRVTVMFDPKDDWPWQRFLLGHCLKPDFEVEGDVLMLPGGLREATLVARRRRRQPTPGRPDGADLVFHRVQRPNRATGKCRVQFYDEHNRRRSMPFAAGSVATPTAALEGLLALANRYPGQRIAVARQGTFATLLEESPANAHRALAVGKIRSLLRVEERPGHFLVHRSIHPDEINSP